MRVVLIAPSIPDYSVEYANALSRKMHVTLIAPKRYFSHLVDYLDAEVDVRLVDWPRHRELRNMFFIPRLVKLIAGSQPDIVHFLSEGVTWLALIPLLLKDYNIVTTMHDISYHPGDKASRRVPRWFANRLLRRSDRVIVHGERLRIEAATRYPALARKLEVLPHVQLRRYVYIAKSQKLERREGIRIRILFFGRIYAYKGLDILIRSINVASSRCENLLVIIAGRGDDIAPYQSIMKDKQLFQVENRYISDVEVAQFFLDSDIVVLPYIAGSQSGVLAIASAFGTPVIVTDIGEIGGSVENDVTGLVVPAGDEQALADAILRLAEDENLRCRLGRASQVAADQAASANIVAQRALLIYKSLGGSVP